MELFVVISTTEILPTILFAVYRSIQQMLNIKGTPGNFLSFNCLSCTFSIEISILIFLQLLNTLKMNQLHQILIEKTVSKTVVHLTGDFQLLVYTECLK